MRVGIGYDVHRLVENRKLILGGVEVAHSLGLEGHSDADVLVHAIMDALLGAAALGDIGKHFPDTDAAYKGISSMKLLAYVAELLQQQGYVVENIDATIIAQKPKLRPFIAQMERNIADVLSIAKEQINVKATTEEGLGFSGRQEGISAQAICALAGLYEASAPAYDSARNCEACGGCARQE
ncbi:MAG: 2-C-methyl-D-erythritol 2,4-cyclodiphosphate synthase [Lachnospiraceae bacterium]|nr:2-C-methyl-D-erythritol 2,4-cyclodiphosphate synthase [Lachnospiraceae bacterium]